eukprot:COSAG06_NODE_408_length_16107_cov_14.957154_4_plen_202_part_00
MFKFQAVLARTQPFLSLSVEKRGDQSRFKCRKMVNYYAIRSTCTSSSDRAHAMPPSLACSDPRAGSCLQQNGPLGGFSLRLSRACLGICIYKYLKRRLFHLRSAPRSCGTTFLSQLLLYVCVPSLSWQKIAFPSSERAVWRKTRRLFAHRCGAVGSSNVGQKFRPSCFASGGSTAPCGITAAFDEIFVCVCPEPVLANDRS